MKKPPQQFFDACASIDVDVHALPIGPLSQYLSKLLRVNTECNLTAVRKGEEAWTRHIYDSLTLVPYLNQRPDGESWVDVGTGGGLPGMVLALVYPGQSVHLIEATGKKCRFLEETGKELGLRNLTVHHARAEEAGHDSALRGQFDVCFSRAVSALNVLMELCVPLLRVDGCMMALKGEGFRQELEEARGAQETLGIAPAQIHLTDHNKGAIIELVKKTETPGKYPRKPGMPNKRPLR
jgi:16S rRNA (guanine527-N7)-methyltransferase